MATVDVEGRQACSEKIEVRHAHKIFMRKLQRKKELIESDGGIILFTS